jgi:hypothetical protein
MMDLALTVDRGARNEEAALCQVNNSLMPSQHTSPVKPATDAEAVPHYVFAHRHTKSAGSQHPGPPNLSHATAYGAPQQHNRHFSSTGRAS